MYLKIVNKFRKTLLTKVVKGCNLKWNLLLNLNKEVGRNVSKYVSYEKQTNEQWHQ
jgi:hypothetical protein